jgi:hypothetical protein
MSETIQDTYTVEEALEHVGFGTTQIVMFLFVGIAWAGDGMEMMLLSYLGPEARLGQLQVPVHWLIPSVCICKPAWFGAVEMQVGSVAGTRELDHERRFHRDDARLVHLGRNFRQIRPEDWLLCTCNIHGRVRHAQCSFTVLWGVQLDCP